MAAAGRAMADRYCVLIIDDNPDDRELYTRLLRRDPDHQYEVLTAETGTTGIAVCRERTPDCVLLDYNLPDADGLDILADLVRDPSLPHRPVVMMTGQGNYETDIEAIKVGAQDYLEKNGITGPLLWRTIRHAIERHRLLVALKKELTYCARLERELRESEAKAQVIVNIAGDGIVTFDQDGRIESFNPTAEPLFGYSSSEMIGQNVARIIPVLFDRAAVAADESAVPPAVRRELLGQRKDGSMFPVEVTMSRLDLEERRLFTCIVRGMARDRRDG